MSTSDEWLSSSDCETDPLRSDNKTNNNNNNNNKGCSAKSDDNSINNAVTDGCPTQEQTQDHKSSEVKLNSVDPPPTVETGKRQVLPPSGNSFCSSCSSLSSSNSSLRSSTTSEISSTSKDLSAEIEAATVVEGGATTDHTVDKQPGNEIGTLETNGLEQNNSTADNFKARPTPAENRHSSSSSSSCTSSSVSLVSASSSPCSSSSSSSNRSSFIGSSSISTSTDEGEVDTNQVSSINEHEEEARAGKEISSKESEARRESRERNPDFVAADVLGAEQTCEQLCDSCQGDASEAAAVVESDGKDCLPEEDHQQIVDVKCDKKELGKEETNPPENQDNSTFEFNAVPAVDRENIADDNVAAEENIADESDLKALKSAADCTTEEAEAAEMATSNYNNGYSLMRDQKDSISGLTTKHLLLDYLQGSDIFNKSHILAPKSLKTYVPTSLSRYNDLTTGSTYSANSGKLASHKSFNTKTKSLLSDSITVNPTSKYVKYANRVALKNTIKEDNKNISTSIDEQPKTDDEVTLGENDSAASNDPSAKVPDAGDTKPPKQPAIEDDEQGHLVYKEGSTISERYQILRTVGEGTFGKVAECLDLKERIRVALKIIKNVDRYRESAKLEINVLQKIKEKDPKGENLCVLILDSFFHGGHVCISFPMLGLSVYDFLKDNSYQPYPMDQVQHISHQLCQAVKFLHEMKLTHTDLKPENILFVCSDYEIIPSVQTVKRKKKPDYKKVLNTEIRLIDFGSATFDHEHHSSVISTRHYRAPEVLLDIGWYQPCDIWSIGCIIFELYTGFTLFQTHEDKEHLAMMERILGSLPYRMTKRSKTEYFWHGRLDWDYHSLAGKYVRETCRPLYRYLMSDNDSDRQLFDLVERMLEYEPAQRLPLTEVIEHPFFSKVRKRI